MAKKKRAAIPSDRLQRNPAVDVDLVLQALRIREELVALGVKQKKGYRLGHPLEAVGTSSTRRQAGRIIAQNR